MKIYAFDMIPADLLKPQVKEYTHTWEEKRPDPLNSKYSYFVAKKTLVTFEDGPDNVGKNLAAGCMWYCVTMREVLAWTVTAKTDPLYQSHGMKGKAINDDHGILLVTDSKAAMIKGLRKMYEMRGGASGYVFDSYEGMGVACAELTLPALAETKSLVGAVASTLTHNVKEKLKRAALKTVYTLMPEPLQKTFVEWAKTKVTLDHMGSYSGAIDQVKLSNKMRSVGYAVYVAPSKYLPVMGNNGYVCRIIGDVATLGDIASHVQRSDDEGMRMGGIFN